MPMPKKTLSTEQKLLQAGMKLTCEKGLSGFGVRQLCARCQVNLGLFHYYFKTKENFDQRLLQTVYNDMLQDIHIDITPAASPRANIEKILLRIDSFARQHRVFLSALAGDVLSGNKRIFTFMTRHFTQHLALLGQQLRRAKLSPAARRQPLASLLAAVVLPVGAPHILMGLLQRMGPGALPPAARHLLDGTVQSQRVVRQRIHLVLNSIFGEEL